MNLGLFKRLEHVRLPLNVEGVAPTGTPIVRVIDDNGAVELAYTLMTAGVTTKRWYHRYQVAADAVVGEYLAQYHAAINPLLSLTDLVTDGAGTGLSSTTGGFTAGMVGEEIIIESGTGFSPGLHTITGYTDTNNITISPAAALSATAGVVRIGNIVSGSDDAYVVRIKTNDDIDIGAGAGASSIIIHIKDSGDTPIPGVKVSIHNAANDDPAVVGSSTTDASGNTATRNIDDGTYTIRSYKAGAVSENDTIVVSGSATHDVTVTVSTTSNPTDPEVCRVRVAVTNISNADTTATIYGKTKNAYTEINGILIKNINGTFTRDTSTIPDSYYLDMTRGALVEITDPQFGLNHEITVPDQENLILTTLTS
jgi:hypothetical protein